MLESVHEPRELGQVVHDPHLANQSRCQFGDVGPW